MKQCLYCGKDFEPIKPTKKYCSESCKVMYCRKNKKTGLSPEAKMTILYNNFIEAIDEFKKEIKTNGSSIVVQSKSADLMPEPVAVYYGRPNTKPLIRSAEAWHSLKRECVSQEEWDELRPQIENADNLSSKQKQIIINTP